MSYFGNNYFLSKTINESGKQISNDFSSKYYRNNGINSTTFLIFKSKKNSLKWFHLLIYRYFDNSYASEKFSELSKVKQTHDDFVFGKRWSYSFILDNLILQIDSDCSYDEDQWYKLKMTL
jgi:hypothetical protein